MRFHIAGLVAVLACALPAVAGADPIPAGTYDVVTNGGSVQIGSFLPAVALPSSGPLPLAIGNQQTQLALPITGTYPGSFNTPITGGSLSGTYNVTVSTASLSVDPGTGAATLDLSFYATFSLSAVILTVPASTTCTLGDANAPVSLHLTTASGGAPWSATTGNFGLADKSFVIPALSCGDASLQSIVALLVGGTTPGSNSGSVTGNAKREPDSTTPPPSSTPTPTGTPPPTEGTPGPTTPSTPSIPSAQKTYCVVPKLKGKTLKRVKKALKKAHCRLGKVRRVKAGKKKVKKGVVIKQGKKPGKRLRAGARVTVTLTKTH